VLETNLDRPRVGWVSGVINQPPVRLNCAAAFPKSDRRVY
jgi:hypothetical protein